MSRLMGLTPDIFVKTIFDIPLQKLQSRKIQVLIFDLDNTITAHNEPEIDERTLIWFQNLPQYGFKACILSNNHSKRVEGSAEKLGIPYISRAAKPGGKGFLKVFQLMNIDPYQVAMIGDQLFTDIWGGNRAGILTILVEPLSLHDEWGTKHISRRAERLVWRFIKKNIPNS